MTPWEARYMSSLFVTDVYGADGLGGAFLESFHFFWIGIQETSYFAIYSDANNKVGL